MGLLVIGDVVTDVVALHGTPMTAGTDTAADIALRPGGSGANTASWAAHLGADARLLTRVGRDSGDWHTAELRRAGVRPHVQVDPLHPTAVVIAMIDGTGERSMLTNRGASGHIGPADWDDSLLDGVRHLHLSGYTLFSAPGLELAATAMRAASLRGVTMSVDPASVGFLRGFGPNRFLGETSAAGIILPNLDEALLLTGQSGHLIPGQISLEISAETAAENLSRLYGTAVVKLGSHGALLAQGGRVIARARAEQTEVIDSTGAGDAFAAGFLTALLSGETSEQALLSGCRAGATAVAQVGGRPNEPITTCGTIISG